MSVDKLLERAKEIKKEREIEEMGAAEAQGWESLHGPGPLKDAALKMLDDQQLGGMNPSEAVYGFAAWLTSRDEVTTMSAHHDSGVIADLVKAFCAIQGLPDVSGSWPDSLIPMVDPIGIGTPPSDDGYDSLRAIYAMALEQAQGGKGLERHANGMPFDQQPICQGGRRFGVGCLIYQAWKKAHETPVLLGMVNGKDRAVRELLGVINYAAAAIIVIQEGE